MSASTTLSRLFPLITFASFTRLTSFALYEHEPTPVPAVEDMSLPLARSFGTIAFSTSIASLDFSSLSHDTTYLKKDDQAQRNASQEKLSIEDPIERLFSGRMLPPDCSTNTNAAACRNQPSPMPTLGPVPAPSPMPTLGPVPAPTVSPTKPTEVPTPMPIATGPRPGSTQTILRNSATGNVPLTVTGQTGTTADLFRIYQDTSLVYNVDSSGQTFTSGGTVKTASDRRLKHNITGIDGALDKVMQLRGVEYNYNATLLPHTEGKRDMGFIAQEVKEVEPLLVKQPSSGDMGEYFHVDYSKLSPLLVESIKDMYARFLDARLDAMKEQVASLEEHFAKERARRQDEINKLRDSVRLLMDENI